MLEEIEVRRKYDRLETMSRGALTDRLLPKPLQSQIEQPAIDDRQRCDNEERIDMRELWRQRSAQPLACVHKGIDEYRVLQHRKRGERTPRIIGAAEHHH